MLSALLTIGLLGARPAEATWSLAAIDPETGDVGVAGATCGPFVWMIGEVVPDEGAVVSLCGTNLKAKRRLAGDLEEGVPPAEALNAVLSDEFDDELEIRQYAVISFSGEGAAFTGGDCAAWAGTHVDDQLVAAGNILASEAVLSDAVAAFHAAAGAPLEERLLEALEAGALAGGDSRCDPEVAAESAFVFVARPGDSRPTVDLTASDRDGAVRALRSKFDGGKSRNWHCASAPAAPGALLGLLALLGLCARRRA